MTGDEKLLSHCEPMKAVTVTVASSDRLTAASVRSGTGVKESVMFTEALYVPEPAHV